MAEQTPLYLDIDSTYGADALGLPFRDLISEGVIAAGDLAVSAQSPNAMGVTVAAGAAWVLGDDNTAKQPCYRVYSDGPVNLGLAAADPTNPRIDRIVARVYDSTFAGVSKQFKLEVEQGVPTAGATLANLSGAAAVPNTALLLANVLVPAGAATIVAGDIADERGRATTPRERIGQWYGKHTGNVTNPGGTNFATGALVLGTPITFEADGVSDYIVEISAEGISNGGSGNSLLYIDLDGADGGLMRDDGGVATAYARGLIVAPATGSHTVNVRFASSTGANGYLYGGPGGAGQSTPIIVTVRKA